MDTSRGGNNVLNKEMWILLDKLNSKLTVNWNWVEGHNNIEGNIEADSLAKSGIGSVSSFWQHIATDDQYENEETYVKIVEESEDKSNKESIQFPCQSCKGEVNDLGIKCTDCKEWYHYSCTLLPPYQLYLYEKSQRKFTCEKCSGVPEGFISRILSTSIKNETSVTKSMINIATQTEIDHKCNADTQTEETQDADTILKLQSSFENQMISMQMKFVEAIDRITESHDKKTQMEQRIESLCVQKENLEKKLRMSESKNQEKIACQMCDEVERELVNCKKETVKLQSMYADLFLEKESEASKYATEIKISKQKLDGANNEIKILKNEIKNYDERLNIKEASLIEMEKKLADQRSEIVALNNEFIGLKTETLQKLDSIQSSILEESISSAQSINTDEQTIKNTEEPKIKRESIPGEKSDPTKRQSKRILMIGTSNTKFISTKYLSFGKSNVEKVLKYTAEDCLQYLDSINPSESYDGIILHLLGNDIIEATPEDCLNKMEDIVRKIKSKGLCEKIIMSLGLPKRDTMINRKVDKLNILIKEKFGETKDVYLCDNSNLSYRGHAANGVLENRPNGKHLTKKGTYILSGNLKHAISQHLGLRDIRGGQNRSWGTSGRRKHF